MKEDVKEFRKTRDYLICIDSDGCVMDTMDVKHMRCFGPCLVYEWDLGEYRDEIIRLWRKVNLLSASRGANRFQGLAQVLRNIHENYTNVEGLEGYLRWAESSQELSDKSLEAAYEKSFLGRFRPIAVCAVYRSGDDRLRLVQSGPIRPL